MEKSLSPFIHLHNSNRSVSYHQENQQPNSHSGFLHNRHQYLIHYEYNLDQFSNDSNHLDDYSYGNWKHCFEADISVVSPTATLFQFIVNGMGISIVGILGILGNILSAIVLSRPEMKSSVTCLLHGLAFCDTLLISMSILVFSLPFLYGYIASTFLWKYANIYFGLLVPYLYPISTTAQTGSVYLTLAVTIERYVAVCHSLKARSICTWGRARICVAVICCLSILYNLPRWWEVVAVPVCEPVKNLTLYVSDVSWLRDDPTYITAYINWSYLLIMYLIPFVGLVVFNVAIYRQVYKANRERQLLSKHQRREMGVATMLSVVVVVFLLCNVLPLVNNILESFYDTSFDHLVAISNFLVVLNSSVNFVIYCTCGERFRRTFIRLLKECFGRKTAERGNTKRGSLNRRSTFLNGMEIQEMSMAIISTRTANTTMNVSISPESKIGNQSSLYGTGKQKNKNVSVSQV